MQLFFETYDDINMKYDETLEFKPDMTKIISAMKKGFNSNSFMEMQLPLLYPEGRPIASVKKHDLMDLLQFISNPSVRMW